MSDPVQVPVEYGTSVRDMVIGLIEEAGMTPVDISDSMGGRVSSRTIYRWARGESTPQNLSDLKVLQELHTDRCKA